MPRHFAPLATRLHNGYLIFGFIFALYVFVGASLRAEEVTIQQFRSEAPQAWNKLKAGIREGFKVDLTEVWGRPTDQPSGVNADVSDGGKVSHTFHMSSDNELIHTVFPDSKSGSQGLRAEAVNDRYGFYLSKEKSNSTNWQVLNLDWSPTARKSKQYGMLQANSIVFYGIMVEGDWLENLVKSPSFEVVSGENVTNNSKQEFKVTFRSNHAVDRANTVLGGTLFFFPANFWVLSRYDVEIKSITFGPGLVAKKTTPGRGRAEFKYQDLAGYPFLKERIMDYKFEGDPPIRYHDEFGPVSRYNGDASAFTLTAFGIPEPASIDLAAGDRARKWWIGISLTGIILCTTALVLRRRARRRAT